MSTLHRFGAPLLCALIGLAASAGVPRPATAAEVTVSVGGFGFSWPEDAGTLYARLQRVAEGVCRSVSVVRLVEYAMCRHCLSATLEEALCGVTASAARCEQRLRQKAPSVGRSTDAGQPC